MRGEKEGWAERLKGLFGREEKGPLPEAPAADAAPRAEEAGAADPSGAVDPSGAADGAGARDFVRMRYFFRGRVQGVGFRYTASVYARELGLTGWVMNRSDGDVEMEVQGSKLRILHLVDRLKDSRPIRIDQVSGWPLPTVKGERRFEERYY